MNKTVKVGVIGYGIVGKGTVETLIKNREDIAHKSGIDVELAAIADLAIGDRRDEFTAQVPLLTTDAMDIINNPEIDIVVELIGGYNPAGKFIRAAMENGKHVVTANKALLATQGQNLFKWAQDWNVEIGFEASVGGGIPIIKVIKEDLAANNIYEIHGIINGTANYILSRMAEEGLAYEEVLKDAQKLGYAEADPSFDVEGIDSAHKITLLSSLAFGTWVDFNKVYTEGITAISPVDIDFAKELNCTIKLLAVAKKHVPEGTIEVRVHPTMIPRDFMLAAVNDSFNAVHLMSDIAGATLHYGRGAGGTPTSSAVVGDIISIARDIAAGSVNRVPALGFVQEIEERYPMVDIKDTSSAFYLRINVMDNPGVLSSIAGILANNDISILSALQRGPISDCGMVPLVFLTHETTGRQLNRAVEEINQLGVASGDTVVIRVMGLK